MSPFSARFEAAFGKRADALPASIVRSTLDAIVAEVDGSVVSWNPGAERLYGWSASEMIGKPIALLLAPERPGEMSRLRSRLRGMERIENFETVHLCKDQRRVDVSLSFSPLFDESGTMVGSAMISRDITERRRAEGRLLESEARSRALVEQAADAIFIADLEGRCREVNPAACKLLGASTDEIVGLTLMDLFPPQELPRLQASWGRLLAEPGRSETAEWRLRRRDGSYVQVEASCKILPDGRWEGIFRDITARKRIEAEAARAGEEERRLRGRLEAVNAASAAISEAVLELPETDLRAVLRTVVEQAQLLTSARYAAVGIGSDPERSFDPWVYVGLDPMDEAIIGSPPRPAGTLALINQSSGAVRIDDLARHAAFGSVPAGHPQMKSLLAVAIRHRGQVVGNLFLADKNGGGPFNDEDVRMVEMLAHRTGVAVVIARLYHSELEARSFLQAVVDQMPEGVLVLDQAGRVTHCNRAALALSCGPTGKVDPFGNDVVFDLRTPSGDPLPFEEIPVVRATSERRALTGLEMVVATKDRLVPVQVSAAPIWGLRGEPAGSVALFQDVTAARELKRVRDEWISVIAHDLRQPVNAVGVCAHNLGKLHAAGPEAEIAESLRTAADALDRLLDDLLDLSLIGAKRLHLETVEADAFELIAGAVAAAKTAIPGGSIALSTSGAPSRVSADPHRIQQVIGNLVGNAVKYGAAGAPIEVRVEGRGSEVSVAVVNHGPGIERADLKRIFDPFVRSSAAREQGAAGLGLGLYICKGIVEAHGGAICAESAPGETTTLRFTLPAV